MSQRLFTNAEKVRARHALNHAVEAGRIVPQPCGKCRAAKAQAHHPDYSKPLEVEWLCAKCHSVEHNQKYPLTKTCTNCGEVFTPKPTKRKRAQVCSAKCRSEQLSRKKKENPTLPVWTKIDFEIAERIRARASEKVSRRALSREFGLHYNTVSAILKGETWVRPAGSALCAALLEGA